MLNSNEISNWIYRTCNAYCWIGKAKKLHSLHSKLKLSTVPEHRTYDLLIRPSHVLSISPRTKWLYINPDLVINSNILKKILIFINFANGSC